MKSNLNSIDEAERLMELYSYKILDTTEESDFNALAELASTLCETPISAVTLIDKERQWFKSITGAKMKECPREFAFCSHTIEQTDVLKVNDLLEDERFAHNPIVTQGPKIRFYAGVPLISSRGYALGAICVLDTKPRNLSSEQISALKKLAIQTVKLLELRKKNFQLEEANVRIKGHQAQLIEQAVKTNVLELSEGIHKSMLSPLLTLNGHGQAIRHLIDDELLTLQGLKDELRKLDSGLMHMSFISDSLNELVQGQNESEIETMDMMSFINDSVTLIKGYLKTLHIDLRLVPFAPLLIDSSPTQLSKIFLTLIIRSIKLHTKELHQSEKWIEISIEKDKQEVALVIRDNAPKLSMDEVTHLFKPFHTHDGKHPFPMLDLYVANSLIKELKGSLKAVDEEKVNKVKMIIPR